MSGFLLQQEAPQLHNIAAPIQFIQYDPAHYSNKLFTNFRIAQPRRMDDWVIQRQAQFLAGRLAARQAMLSIQRPPEPIPMGEKREPLWPENIFGSISHGKGISAATASLVSPVREKTCGVGLDIQMIFNEQETASVQEKITSPYDKRFFQQGVRKLTHDQLVTLVFSAKESFFKAAFKQVGYYFDFDMVSLKSVDVDNGILTLTVEDSLCDKIKKGDNCTVEFEFLEINRNEYLLAYCKIC